MGLQGKKEKGRLASIKSLHSAIKLALRLMGLDAEDSGNLLGDLRTAALSRSVKGISGSLERCASCKSSITSVQDSRPLTQAYCMQSWID